MCIRDSTLGFALHSSFCYYYFIRMHGTCGQSRRSRRVSDHRWLGRCAYSPILGARTRPQMSHWKSVPSGVDLTLAQLSLLPNTEPDWLQTVALSPCRVSATQICLPPGLPVHLAQDRTPSNWPSDSPWNVSFGHHKSGFLVAVRCRRWSRVVHIVHTYKHTHRNVANMQYRLQINLTCTRVG